jgi:hypothetical protein
VTSAAAGFTARRRRRIGSGVIPEHWPRRDSARASVLGVPRGRYWVKRLEELPLVRTDDPDDLDWYPIQHHLWIDAFGVNVYGGDSVRSSPGGQEIVHPPGTILRRPTGQISASDDLGSDMRRGHVDRQPPWPIAAIDRSAAALVPLNPPSE